jgi:hypothetical protein
VCTAGTRKKTEYKQLPKGYAEVLEHTQLALVATVHKLYGMLRNSQPWDLGEPELNDRGQPVIHDIASKLGCIRPIADADLPVHSGIPEDEASMAELARQLERQQPTQPRSVERASSEELDHSDLDTDYRHAAFGSKGNVSSASPQSLAYTDFDANPSESFGSEQSPTANNVLPYTSDWLSSSLGMADQRMLLQQSGAASSYLDIDLLNQGLLESNFGTIKPHVLSCPNPEVMMGVGDPMIYGGYDPEALRL